MASPTHPHPTPTPQVVSIAEMGAYCRLLEYDGVEGMILLSELSRRRIRSINKLIKVGRNEVCMVIRVDKEKVRGWGRGRGGAHFPVPGTSRPPTPPPSPTHQGYIDLSKRRVSAEEVSKAEDKFNKAKAVHSIVKHVSSKQRVPMASLYPRLAWPLYKKYGHAFDAFSLAVAEDANVLDTLDLSVGERTDVLTYVRARMTPQPLKIRADVQVTCFTEAGINAIRAALSAAQAVTCEGVPIKVRLIAPPLFVMTTQCLDKAAGIDALTTAIEAVRVKISASGGQLSVKAAPAVTSASDDADAALASMMEEMAAESDSEDNVEEEDADRAHTDDEAELGVGKVGGEKE